MDTLSNMLITIKNGYMAKKPAVSVPLSNFKLEIAYVLEKEGFVGKVAKGDKSIEIELVYEDKKPRVTEIKKVSNPGLRVYKSSKSIKAVKGGIGMTIVSTSKGVMTGDEARSKKLGGEIICQIW
jgi:small subunit ribosomal protein S8